MFDLDAHLGVHATALRVRGQRAELIAQNLANADTPNYKARDIDFRAALAAASGNAAPGGALRLATTQGAHVAGVAGGAPEGPGAMAGQFRTPLAPALDGNTVETQVEQAAFAENAVRFQATLTFLNSRFRGLMTAITGQS